MRVTKAQAADNRARIIENAVRLFQGKGFDGVGIAELMAATGLTNGAFYGHFESKDHLIAQACAPRAPGDNDPWAEFGEGHSPAALGRFSRAYLSPPHVKNRSGGCPLAALGADAARQIGPARKSFTENLNAHLDALSPAMPGPKAMQREQALSTLSALVGALVLARAVDDPRLSQALLETTAQDLRLRGRA